MACNAQLQRQSNMLMHVHMLLHRGVSILTWFEIAYRGGPPRRQSEPARVANASTRLPRSPLVIHR